MAAAWLHLLEHYDRPLQVNVGVPTAVTIREIAGSIADLFHFEGESRWDTS